jgi:hypothetical protein
VAQPPLDFPNSPTIGQIYNAPNGVAYVWDGVKWNVVGGTGSGGVTIINISPTPPANPQPGWLWWRNDPDGNLYIWYNDGSSSEWVPAMSSVGRVAPAANLYYLVAGAVAGVPLAAMSVGQYVAALAFLLPAGLVGSQAVAKVAATAATDFAILVNGVAQGSMHWPVNATVANFVWAAPIAINIGDRLEVVTASPADVTLSDISWTLKGSV